MRMFRRFDWRFAFVALGVFVTTACAGTAAIDVYHEAQAQWHKCDAQIWHRGSAC